MLGRLIPDFENALPNPDAKPDRRLLPLRTAAMPPATPIIAAPAIVAGPLTLSSTPPDLAVERCRLLACEAPARFDAPARLLPLDFDLLVERERVEPDFALLEFFERLAALRVVPDFVPLEFFERLAALRVVPFLEEPLFVRPLELFFCVRVFVWAMFPLL